MRCPGVLDLLDAAVRNGADLVGSIDPLEIDCDPKGQLDDICVDKSNPVLCDSQTPTASVGTSVIKCSRSALASSSVSPTMTLVAQTMPTCSGSRPRFKSAASMLRRCCAISRMPLPAPNT